MVQLPGRTAPCSNQFQCGSPRIPATVPSLVVSPLGDSVVTMGAVRSALDFVEKETLNIELRHKRAPKPPPAP
ncbi:hypothetical protein StoSoilB3_19690 [Arthrobacter sp. StoSoilB3]|nr:hypothetical protein StoSoilB3_19690 [Arthrobacter sp. StoSoilB3]